MTSEARDIIDARTAFNDARLRLADAIRRACPAGHSHAYVQHRDRQAAWCEACGYAEDGTRIRRLAAESTEEA